MQKNTKTVDYRGLLLGMIVLGLVATLFVLPNLNSSKAGSGSGKGLSPITKSHDPNLENYDIRLDKDSAETLDQFRQESGTSASAIADLRDGFVSAENTLRERVPTLKVDYSQDLRKPNVITPDVWKSEVARLTTSSSQNRVDILKNFLKENNGLIGVTDEAVNNLKVKVDASNPNGYLSFVYLTQEINGIPVYGSELRAGFTKTNEMIRVLNDLAPGIDVNSASGEFGDPLNAVRKSFGYINQQPTKIDVTRNDAASNNLKTVFGEGDWATTAEKMYFPTEIGVVRPAWRVLIWLPVNAFYVIVDAETGKMLSRENLTADQTQSATFNVYTNPSAYMNSAESPAPLTPYPGADPTTGTQGTMLTRNNVTLIGNEAPNPGMNNLGWITDGANITDGNNVEAGLDIVAPNGVDAPETGSPNRVFDAPTWNPPPGSPAPGDAPSATQARRGAVIQMFYVMNLYHDELYSLGFTEPFENYQNDNFGRGGVAADRVSAEGQDSSGTNNANFSAGADGTRGRMQMFLWDGPTPDYDGTTDADIIIHEVTHGTSTRLHNGLGNQGGMMGEGWSDWYAQTLLAQPSDPINGAYSMGGYALYQVAGLTTFNANYYYGIRKWPKAVKSFTGGPARPGCGNAPCPHNPLSFRHINAGCFTELGSSATANISAFPMTGAQSIVISATCSQVHNAGEIWSSALWEVRALMIQRLGFAAGTKRVLQVVTDGMKLAPANPMMLQERDAIIAAASALPAAPEASADVADVREGFRIRGMGFSASTQSATAVTEAFDLPNIVLVDPFSVSDAPGNNNGFPEPGENVTLTVNVTNTTGSTVTNVMVNANGGTNVNVGTVNDGQTVPVQIPFTVPLATPCGSFYNVTINASSDVGSQTPKMYSFRVGIPVGGAPAEFTNSTPIDMPSGQPTTTSGPFAPYPSNITVSGLSGQKIIKLRLNNYRHEFEDDLDFLLVGPGGQKYIFMSDVGGVTEQLTPITFTVSDSGDTLLPDATAIMNGVTYKPSNVGANDAFDAPAPGTPYSNAAPGGTDTFASVFGIDGAAMNGTWSLYGDDDAASDPGRIENGWTLIFESDNYTCPPIVPSGDARADFDGDGRTDLTVFRPSEGNWYINGSTSGFGAINWGLSGDTLIPGDYDGDGKDDTAVFRPSADPAMADFFILNSNGFTVSGYSWGISGDIPVVGDYDGDGKADAAIYRPSDTTWYIIKSTGGATVTVFGAAGVTPVSGDFDGDGTTDLTTFNAGTWTSMLSGGGMETRSTGSTGDALVQGDYDGDGEDDQATFRASDGNWRAWLSSTDSMVTIPFGASGDIAVPGDYDGDGTEDQAIYRGAGQWWINGSTSGVTVSNFGLGSDTPVPSRANP